MSQTVKTRSNLQAETPRETSLGPLCPVRHRDVGTVRLLHGAAIMTLYLQARGLRMVRDHATTVVVLPDVCLCDSACRRLARRPLPWLSAIGLDRRPLLHRRLCSAGPRLDRDSSIRPSLWSSPATGSSSRTSPPWSAIFTPRAADSRTRPTISSTWGSTSALPAPLVGRGAASAHRRGDVLEAAKSARRSG